MILSKNELSQSTTRLARSLLGCFLSHQIANSDGSTETLVGRIVETEAYLFRNDPACHAHKGKTKRNAPMFGAPGQSYVYLIYGMYNCFNVVSAPLGKGEAVLIRALEPIQGIETMKRNRGNESISALCSGPGKLTQALGITLAHNELCLRRSQIRLHSRDSFSGGPARVSVQTSGRIGIKDGAELPLRFLIKDNTFVSRPA